MVDALLRATLPLVAGQRLVDLLCGAAPAAGVLALAARAYVGQDPHAESVQAARRRWATDPAHARMRFMAQGIEEFVAGNPAAFDLARVPVGVAERLPDPGWMRFLQVMRPVLGPGGRVLVPAFDGGWWGHALRATESRLPEIPGLNGVGVSVRSLAHHAHLLERSGFQVAGTHRVGLPGFKGRALLVATRVV